MFKTDVRTLGENQYFEKFSVITNPFHTGEHFNNHLFSIGGPDIDFVERQNPDRIWTMVRDDDFNSWIINGFHMVNRLHYLRTWELVPNSDRYVVFLG